MFLFCYPLESFNKDLHSSETLERKFEFLNFSNTLEIVKGSGFYFCQIL